MSNSCNLSAFLLVTSLAGLSSDTGIVHKSVCIGDSAEVFQNIASPKFKIKISLYIISVKEDAIALWFVQNSSKEDTISETYKGKLFFENGTILIRNILSTDEATYKILYDIDGWHTTTKVQIHVLAPPTEPCKLKIRHEENFLIASLDDPKCCGIPVASVCWMDYPGISRRSKTILELPPGKEAGTYYACFEGEALQCVKNSSDWKKCEYITIGSIGGGNSPTSSPDIPQIKTTSHWIVVLVAFVLFIVIAILSMKLWKRFGKVPKDPLSQQGRDQQLLQVQTDTNADGEQRDEDSDDSETQI